MKLCVRYVLLVALLFFHFGSLLVAQDQPDLQAGMAMNLFTRPVAIYSEADRSSDKLGEIEPYALVEVLEVDDKWAEVTYEGYVGWFNYAPLSSSLFQNITGPVPSPRGYHEMVYDAESDRVILFGGQSPGSTTAFNDTWTYEVRSNTWTQMNPAQSPPGGNGSLAYDSQSDRAIYFFGSDFPPTTTVSETWAYDLNTDTWSNLVPDVAPPPMLGPRMAYDAESDRIILFGGEDSFNLGSGEGLFNDTWAYDYDSNTWTKMEPAQSPPGMNYYPMAYDQAVDRVILTPMAYGIPPEEIWAYDYNANTWEVKVMIDSPGRRDYSRMVYVPPIDRLVLFGSGEPIPRDDTWLYDFDSNSWNDMQPETAPRLRGWHTMAYSSADDLIILFGGGENRSEFTMETWLYDPNNNTWTQVGP